MKERSGFVSNIFPQGVPNDGYLWVAVLSPPASWTVPACNNRLVNGL